MLKRIPKSDISIRPFKAYKEWDELSADVSVLVAEEGNYSNTQMININQGHLSGSSYNKHSLYGQIKSTFYNGKEDNPIQRYGIKTNEFTIFGTTAFVVLSLILLKFMSVFDGKIRKSAAVFCKP